MAKRQGARPPVSRRYRYTPELLASGRRRYEHSDESIPDIAVDFGIHKTTFLRMARRQGWVRYVAPARDLPAAVKLAAAAEVLTDNSVSAQAGAPAPADGVPALPPVAATIARLHRAVLEELAAVERLRAELKRAPQSPLDAERTSRTLSSLTDTLAKLARQQAAAPLTGPDYDDMPADLDEFRDALARRIEAFLASRPDVRDAEDLEPPRADGA